MGKKQLLLNLISTFIAFGTSLGISFLLTPYLISTVGKDTYSFYPMSNNFVSYMTVITVALNSMASRFITVEMVKRNLSKAKTYYSSVFLSNIIMIGVLSIPMILIVVYLDKLLEIPSHIIFDIKLLFGLVFMSMGINLLTSVFSVSTYAKNRLDLRAGGEILNGLIKALLFLCFFTLFKPSIVFIGVVILISSICNFFIQLMFTRWLMPGFKVSYKYFDFLAVRTLFYSGIWNSINSLGSKLLLGISLLVSNIFIGVSASGDIAIVQVIPSFISSIIVVIFSVFMPRLTHKYADGAKGTLVKEAIFSQKVLGIMSTTPVILMIIFGENFFQLWVPNENAYRLQILSTLTIIPLIIHGNMWTIYGLNIVLNKIKTPSLTLVALGVLNLITIVVYLYWVNPNIYAIPIISAFFNISYYLFFIPIYAAKKMQIKFYTFQVQVIKGLLYSCIFIYIGSLAQKNINITSWEDFFLWGGIFGIIGMLINAIFVLNKKDYNEMKVIFLKRNKKNQKHSR